MGFPTWTLWGMGLAAAGALMFMALAFIAQTPRLINRLGLTGARLDLRARSLTGYGLALLLLATGFFVAGVPLGGSETAAVGDIVDAVPAEDNDTPAVADDPATSLSDVAPEKTGEIDQTPVAPQATRLVGTGAMDGPLATPLPAAGEVLSPTIDVDLQAVSETTATSPAATQSAAILPDASPTATPTATVTPTPTPSPTMTPTPILGPAAVVGEDTSTLVVRRIPGGEPLWLLYRGDTVLLLPGHAFHSGDQWREVSTVDGVGGWVQDVFLDYGEDGG